uniref:Uncharacterized protein n=1 Tax=Triticum urartu TaxID=4572 RepID=A0A8R7QKE1_TRIUA
MWDVAVATTASSRDMRMKEYCPRSLRSTRWGARIDRRQGLRTMPSSRRAQASILLGFLTRFSIMVARSRPSLTPGRPQTRHPDEARLFRHLDRPLLPR